MCFAPQRRAIFHLSSGQRFGESTCRPSEAPNHWKKHCESTTFLPFRAPAFSFLLSLSPLWSFHFFSSPLWLFPPLLFHLSILSEVWLLNFLRQVRQCRTFFGFYRGNFGISVQPWNCGNEGMELQWSWHFWSAMCSHRGNYRCCLAAFGL